MIAAIGTNSELGSGNELLWHLPDDFKWFVSNTKGKPIIMGRKTMESLGKPLKNRTNIVLSRSENELPEGFVKVSSLDQAFNLEDAQVPEVMIIGGAQIYEQALPFANRLIITHVDAQFPQADAYFPKINFHEWSLIFEETHSKDENHAYDFRFCIYERK